MIPSGELYATSTITTGYSDIRLKDNVQSISGATDKITKLHGVFYRLNSVARGFGHYSHGPEVGLLAQEVQQVLPEAVKQAVFDRGPDGTSLSGEYYLTVQYEKILPVIIEAVKEQQTIIDTYREILGLKKHGRQ